MRFMSRSGGPTRWACSAITITARLRLMRRTGRHPSTDSTKPGSVPPVQASSTAGMRVRFGGATTLIAMQVSTMALAGHVRA